MFRRRYLTSFSISTLRSYSQNVTGNQWQSVVGLEVHAQINSSSKLFSGASTKFSSPVNSNVALLDCSIPGTLPVLNKRCVEAGVLTALALGCQVNPISYFDRKHYFYADLPMGYQITQQRTPLAINGELKFQVYTPGVHKKPYTANVKIKQIQLEQDSGRSLHDTDRSLVDLNRAGVPLMELVFDPDLKDGEEAAALVKELIMILQKLNTCSCKMEEGALRVDANVSINKNGEPLGVRTEIKNIGSVRGVAGAIESEIKRQINVRESGGVIVNETRAWDAVNKATVSMRDKEVVQDYRFMPEPNLPPLSIAMGPVEIGCINADRLKESIPELPEQTRRRLQDEGLTPEQTIVLVNDISLLTIFENAVNKRNVNRKLMANFLINELNTLMNKNNMEPNQIKCPIDYFAEIVSLLETDEISRVTSKVLLEEIVLKDNGPPSKIISDRGLFKIADDIELQTICEDVIRDNEKAVKAYRAGKTKAFQALMGAVAKKSNNRADMVKCTVMLKKLLNNK